MYRIEIEFTYTYIVAEAEQHEHLGGFGIINMNGRIFDPNTATFFSPDPFVQAPYNSQNFNRYSYCLNNPLMYTDPSGEVFFLIANAVKDFFVNVGNSVGNLINGRTDKWNWTGTKNSLKIYGGLFQGDAKQILSRIFLEIPQTALGYLYTQGRNLGGNVDRVDYFDGATFATKENASKNNGLSLGSFININNKERIDGDFGKYIVTNYLYMHEYGHYRQSQAFGPLYLPRFGLPSLLSTNFFTGRNDQYLHPVEQDANARAYNYFKNKDGFVGWDNTGRYPKELGYIYFGWNDVLTIGLSVGRAILTGNPFALFDMYLYYYGGYKW